MRCLENPFWFGCLYAEPHNSSKLIRSFNTQLGAQGSKNICEIQHYFPPLFPHCGPSHVWVIIVTNMVILFLDRVHKKIQSGLDPIYSIILYENLLPVSLWSMVDMGESLKKWKFDIFPIRKIVNREITF